MLKKLSLLFAASLCLAVSAFANPTVYKVVVSNNTKSVFPPGVDLFLTKAQEISGCKVYWPDSKLQIDGATTFTLNCDGNLPPALKLSFITETTQKQGQTCWGTYYTSQFISDSTTNIAILPNFSSYGTCESPANPPHILPNYPAPPTN